MDQDHLLTELYAISNVPSVVWIDENNMIARPAAAEFGTDTFTEITGISRETHMQQVRDWVAKESQRVVAVLVPLAAIVTAPCLKPWAWIPYGVDRDCGSVLDIGLPLQQCLGFTSEFKTSSIE